MVEKWNIGPEDRVFKARLKLGKITMNGLNERPTSNIVFYQFKKTL
jgi:hypothetical protein